MGTIPMAREIARTRSSANELCSNGPEEKLRYSHTNIAERGSHSRRGNAKNLLDCLASPAQLGNDLIGSQRRKVLFKKYLAYATGELMSIPCGTRSGLRFHDQTCIARRAYAVVQ